MFSQRGMAMLAGPLTAIVLGLTGCAGGADTSHGETAGPDSSHSRAADEQAVRDTFERFQAAFREQDGDAVVELVTTGTIGYYDELAELTATGGPEEIGARSMTDRMNIALLRHRLGAERVAQMDGRTLLSFAVREGFIDKSSVEGVELGEITFSGSTAVGTGTSPDQQAGLELAPRNFAKEDGQWRVDLLPAIEATDKALVETAKKHNMTEDAVILKLVSVATGTRIDESIFARP
ncbi:hypothetical protein [Saccharomonospora glauca]|jgi:hypothetical protein|uniref:Lipoprotein n=1 Tax=Saccharomonospora glauca K62 TaxID=928724 RepID=I1D5Y4_9PSEU|nr:hypothetical protein [Saccharomonospora glauca]EIF00359.1 hypothetical protein SacglDRAFT_03498 [Saccharomonospora glauca K62]